MHPEKEKYYLVEASALPDIYHKVLEVQRLLDLGEETSANRAVKTVGISRSAFYKYKDLIHPFSLLLADHSLTLNLRLQDDPSSLPQVLALVHEKEGKILSLHQDIPQGATFTLSLLVETPAPQGLLAALSQLPNVVDCQVLAG